MAPEYYRPTTLDQALALAAEPDAVLLAGGTDVLVWLKDGRCPIASLVSLRDLPDLRGVSFDGVGRWTVGAATTHDDVVRHPELGRRFPALAAASRSVGSPAVRSSATVVGNICTAAPSADTAGPLLAYGAEVVVAGRQGSGGSPGHERRVPAREFFRGPGRSALEHGEVVTALRLPDPGAHGASFRKLSRRRAVDIALVSVTALVWLDAEGRCGDLRLALGAVAPTPILVPDASEAACGQVCDASLLSELARRAVAACCPIDDLRASAAYRLEMVAALSRAAVEEAWTVAAAASLSTGGGAS